MTFRGGATAAPQRVHVCSCHGLPTRGIARGGVEWHRGEIARARVSALYRDAAPGARAGERAPSPHQVGGKGVRSTPYPWFRGTKCPDRRPQTARGTPGGFTAPPSGEVVLHSVNKRERINMVLHVAPALARRALAALLTAVLTSVAVLMTHEIMRDVR